MLPEINGYVCLLKKRPDPLNIGSDILRWSMSFKERCFCQMVRAPRGLKAYVNEPCKEDEMQHCLDNSCKLWFTDDLYQLTQPQNWNEKTLDTLLQRSEYCGKLIRLLFHLIIGLL